MHNIYIYIYNIIYELLNCIMHKSNIIIISSYAYYSSTSVVCIVVCILEYSRSSATVRFHGMHTMHTTTLLLPVAMDIGSMYTISLKGD